MDTIPDIDNQYVKLCPGQRLEFGPEIEENPNFEPKDVYHKTRKIAYELGLEENDWVYDEEFLDQEDER